MKLPDQGPGTKLVMKGLKAAFPKIAEQREYRDRKMASRKDDGCGNGQGPPSVHHSKAGRQGEKRSQEAKEGSRLGNSRRGTMGASQRRQADDDNANAEGIRRSGIPSSRQGNSIRADVGTRGSRRGPEDNVMPEANRRRGPSVRFSATDGGNRGSRDDSRDGGARRRQPSTLPSNPENRRSHNSSAHHNDEAQALVPYERDAVRRPRDSASGVSSRRATVGSGTRAEAEEADYWLGAGANNPNQGGRSRVSTGRRPPSVARGREED